MKRLTTRATVVSAPLLAGVWLALSLSSFSFAQSAPAYAWASGWPSYPAVRRNEAMGVAVDSSGRVYESQATRQPVMVFDAGGRYLGNWGFPAATDPHSIRIDPEGNFWIADISTHQVLKFGPGGGLIFALGVRKRRGSDANHFNKPTDIAFGLNNDAFISDGYGNSRVVHVTRDGRYLGAWGSHGSGAGQFRLPHSIATDASGLVYVADRENRRVQVFTSTGGFVRQFRTPEKPFGLYITPRQLLYICYEYPCTVGIYDLFGSQLAYWGGKVRGRRPGNMADPHMIAVGPDGSLYTAELRGHRVQKWVPR